MSLRKLANIYRLGVKELWSLWRDPMMLVLIAYVFSVGVFSGAKAMPETLNYAPISIVDEDDTALSRQIISAFYPPNFTTPQMISMGQMDSGMDSARHTLALYITLGLQREVMAGRCLDLEQNVNATHLSQPFTGSGAIQQIVRGEINPFVQRYHGSA